MMLQKDKLPEVRGAHAPRVLVFVAVGRDSVEPTSLLFFFDGSTESRPTVV